MTELIRVPVDEVLDLVLIYDPADLTTPWVSKLHNSETGAFFSGVYEDTFSGAVRFFYERLATEVIPLSVANRF